MSVSSTTFAAGQATRRSDEDAEFDDPTTIAAIRDAIASHGHEVVGLEADATLPAALVAANVDVVFNIAEGKGSRSRESQVPALLDLLGIPFTGSDAVALGVTLDKSVAKAVARAAGVATPLWTVMTTGDEPLPERFSLPAIVKPLHEGSSKGIEADSVVTDERRLRERRARGDRPLRAARALRGVRCRPRDHRRAARLARCACCR